MTTGNPLYDAAKELMPSLRFVPTDPSLYTSFAVAGDQYGHYHLLSHYSEHSLLYVKVTIEDGHVALDVTFKRTVDDLFFYGCEPLGELFMRPATEALDFDWYRNHVASLFKALLQAAPGAIWSLPKAFHPDHVGQNNGPVILRLTQSLRHRQATLAQPRAASASRYAF